MNVESGVVINGEVLPCPFVLRVPGVGWAPSEWGCRPRKGHIVDQVCLHWTGSPTSKGPEGLRQGVRNMKARPSKVRPGKLEVGIHFIVLEDGVYQTADMGVATVHVGHRPTILRSVGIEIDYPGTHAQALKLGVEHETVRGVARGLPVKAMRPPEALVQHVVRLVDWLTSTTHPAMRIPRQRGGIGKPGILEHADVSDVKVDTAGVFFGALGLR